MKKYHLKNNSLPSTLYKENIPIGVHLGCNSSKLKKGWHISMTPFLVGTRNKSCVLTLDTTLDFLVRALYVLTIVLKSGGNLLIVNNNLEFSNILKQTQKKIKQSQILSSQIAFSDGKWVGGFLTNWNNFLASAKKFTTFNHRFNYYLSKNNIELPKYKKWQACFQGYFHKNLFSKQPTIILLLSPNENQNVIQEAYRLNIPIIAITDSNTDISLITYPIPANTQSIFFTRFCLNWILRALQNHLF